LDSRQEVLEIVLEPSNGASARNVSGEKLLDARIAGAHHREFGGHKEGIGQNQHGDSDNLEKRQTVHPGCEDSIRAGQAQSHAQFGAHQSRIGQVTAMSGTNYTRAAYSITAGRRTESILLRLGFLELKLLLSVPEVPFFTGQLARSFGFHIRGARGS
jgi:hypothetical protein